MCKETVIETLDKSAAGETVVPLLSPAFFGPLDRSWRRSPEVTFTHKAVLQFPGSWNASSQNRDYYQFISNVTFSRLGCDVNTWT